MARPFADQHFGSAQAALGHALRYGGQTRTIVGVLSRRILLSREGCGLVGIPAAP